MAHTGSSAASLAKNRNLATKRDFAGKPYRNSRIVLPVFGFERTLPDPTDLWAICSALEHFSLPAALGNPKDNALVFWNQAFQRRAGFSEIELAQARLTSLILLDESYSALVLQDHNPEHVVRFVPCVLKKPLTNEWVPGRALKRKDGILLAMLDLPVGDVALEGFIHGHLMGREEERDRIRQFFHDILSSKILVASFVAHEIYQSLAAKGAEETEDLARVKKLLQEAIDDILTNDFEEPMMSLNCGHGLTLTGLVFKNTLVPYVDHAPRLTRRTGSVQSIAKTCDSSGNPLGA